MLNLVPSQIARIVTGQAFGSDDRPVSGAVSDSRLVRPGSLFVALRGERTDGHDYANQALAAGASAILTEEYIDGLSPQIVVEDCRKALAELAQFQLQRYPVRIIGITGSMGKTCTKDLTASVLSQRFSVHKSEGNRNTEVSLPMTIFDLEPHHQVAVLEMGMVAQGDIAELCAIAPPDLAIICNILEVHLERFNSIDEIADTKGEIFQALSSKGIALVNNDDPRVVAQSRKALGRKVSYGLTHQADMMATDICSHGIEGSTFSLIFPDGAQQVIHLSLPGVHMVNNALPAALAGHLMGMTPVEIACGLSQATLSDQRLHIRELAKGITLVDDSYNSNPYSAEAALRLVADIRQERPLFIVLGDMLELGEHSRTAHLKVGRLVADLHPDFVLTRGELSALIGKEAANHGMPEERVQHFTDNEETLGGLREVLVPGALVLIKGSRGMMMERIVEGLLTDTLRNV
ncbi:MAG: UDP-N-acetylmuramoyl-tripeptide--D-alanyl-D-alanine ligase [Symbiobacteriaceae bacterium]|nr:UDP-N-acetylmuramoyl-tripeptide--D-alanyl-D-alanine ligase [Symbiobacteriaceae bacterium]